MMPDPTAGAPAAPSATPADGSAPADTSQGYTISIMVGADQSIKVSVDPGTGDDSSDGAAAAGSDDGSGDDSQTVPNIKAACKVVMDIFNNAGQIQDATQGQDQMSSGYGSGGM